MTNEYTPWIFDRISEQYIRLVISRDHGVTAVQFSPDAITETDVVPRRTKGFAKWQTAYRCLEQLPADSGWRNPKEASEDKRLPNESDDDYLARLAGFSGEGE
jgi:hypothetical protein